MAMRLERLLEKLIPLAAVVPIALFANGSGDVPEEQNKCNSYNNTCLIEEVQTEKGPVIYVFGHVDIGEGDGFKGLWTSILNDYKLNINPYLRSTGRKEIKETIGLIDTTISRLDKKKCNFYNRKTGLFEWDKVKECSANYGFQLCTHASPASPGTGPASTPPSTSKPTIVPVPDTQYVKQPVYITMPDTQYIKQPVYVPVSDSQKIKWPVPVIVQDTLEDTVKTNLLKYKGEPGLFRKDQIEGSNVELGFFYRIDNGDKIGIIMPAFNFTTLGEDLRVHGGLENIILVQENGNEDNKILANAYFGFHGKNIGGGIRVGADANENGFFGPYFILGQVFGNDGPVAHGKVGVIFNPSYPHDFTQFTEAGLNYESSSKNFVFGITGKSGDNYLTGKYTNSVDIKIGFGNKCRILLNGGFETGMGTEIQDETVREALKRLEFKYGVTGEWKFNKNSKLYLKIGDAKGQWKQDNEYDKTEVGAKLGVVFNK